MALFAYWDSINNWLDQQLNSPNGSVSDLAKRREIRTARTEKKASPRMWMWMISWNLHLLPQLKRKKRWKKRRKRRRRRRKKRKKNRSFITLYTFFFILPSFELLRFVCQIILKNGQPYLCHCIIYWFNLFLWLEIYPTSSLFFVFCFFFCWIIFLNGATRIKRNHQRLCEKISATNKTRSRLFSGHVISLSTQFYFIFTFLILECVTTLYSCILYFSVISFPFTSFFHPPILPSSFPYVLGLITVEFTVCCILYYLYQTSCTLYRHTHGYHLLTALLMCYISSLNDQL